MDVDVNRLLALPAAERLELAEMLRTSVGYPRDVENLTLPAWRRAHLDGLLSRYASE